MSDLRPGRKRSLGHSRPLLRLLRNSLRRACTSSVALLTPRRPPATSGGPTCPPCDRERFEYEWTNNEQYNYDGATRAFHSLKAQSLRQVCRRWRPLEAPTRNISSPCLNLDEDWRCHGRRIVHNGCRAPLQCIKPYNPRLLHRGGTPHDTTRRSERNPYNTQPAGN